MQQDNLQEDRKLEVILELKERKKQLELKQGKLGKKDKMEKKNIEKIFKDTGASKEISGALNFYDYEIRHRCSLPNPIVTKYYPKKYLSGSKK